MKKTLFAFATLLIMAACNNKPTTVPATDVNEASNEEVSKEQENTYLSAIDRYLVEEIGKHYAQGEHCVPIHNVVAIDESNAEDILVWGDFWVFNYNQVGDTLKCVSGGNHPGLMHVRQTDNGFEVNSFDQVEDGSNNLPSAKRIFGDKYEAFQAINSNKEDREKLRAEGLATYVKKQGLSATTYEDYGWPAKQLP